MSHYLLSAGHPGQCCMYDTLERIFYWHHIASSVNFVVRNYTSCALNSTKYFHWHKMQLFAASKPIDFAAMDIARSFPNRIRGREYILVITNPYSKLTRAIHRLKTTVTQAANLFMNHLLILYGIPANLLTGDGTRYVSLDSAIMCALTLVKHHTITAYHP